MGRWQHLHCSLQMSGNIWKSLPAGKKQNSQTLLLHQNYHIRINTLWMLGMYFEMSFELISLGHQTNQHKGTAWEIRAIIQMSGHRLIPGMFLHSPLNGLSHLQNRFPTSLTRITIFSPPAIVNVFYPNAPSLHQPWPPCSHQVERWKLFLSSFCLWKDRLSK